MRSTRETPVPSRNRSNSEESETPNPPSATMRIDENMDNSETLHLVPIELIFIIIELFFCDRDCDFDLIFANQPTRRANGTTSG
jgi:hypothetical protein